MERVHQEAAEEAAAMSVGINIPFDLSGPSALRLSRQQTSMPFFEVRSSFEEVPQERLAPHVSLRADRSESSSAPRLSQLAFR